MKGTPNRSDAKRFGYILGKGLALFKSYERSLYGWLYKKGISLYLCNLTRWSLRLTLTGLVIYYSGILIVALVAIFTLLLFSAALLGGIPTTDKTSSERDNSFEDLSYHPNRHDVYDDPGYENDDTWVK